MHRVGKDVAERGVVIPAQFRVNVTRRVKYVLWACEGTVVWALESRHIVYGGLPTEAMIVKNAVRK